MKNWLNTIIKKNINLKKNPNNSFEFEKFTYFNHEKSQTFHLYGHKGINLNSLVGWPPKFCVDLSNSTSKNNW